MDVAAVSTGSPPACTPAPALPAPAAHPHLAPGQMALIYDGRCGFCIAQSARLARLSLPTTIVTLDAHAPGVLERFGGAITMERAMAAVQLVEPRPYRAAAAPGRTVGTTEGPWRISEGCEAVVRTLATRRWVGALVHIYYLPVVRHACDALYRLIARNRYRISRWWPVPGASGEGSAACPDGACVLPQDRPRPTARPASR